MKNIFSKLVLVAFLLSLTGTAFAEDCKNCKKSSAQRASVQSKAAVCKRAQSTAELNVNNVRALINGYGNMWYDGSIAQYHLPKTSNTCPLFCAALWIGGTDVNDQLRIAALRFGSEGDDYWPGPLELNSAYVDLPVCNKYDKHYIITQNDVRTFMGMWDYPSPEELAAGATPTRNSKYDDSKIAQVIKEWPAHGEGNQSKYLAPFFDADGDGVYNWENGDYPYYDFSNELCPRTWKAEHPNSTTAFTAPTREGEAGIVKGGNLSDQVLKGDQTIWWVFNDMGNVHTESDGQPIGLEIRAQAFAFSTNDEINNMTFYSYEIINRSTYTLKDTYFSQWVDPDLGYAHDDYVGCDVKRGLGYCYNGDENDGPGSGSYSGIPPAVGIDFFQGPYMDPDGKDNPKIDIDKIRANPTYEPMLKNYYVTDEHGITKIDTFALTQDADLFYDENTGGAWYFKQGDTIGNCAINGVNFGNGIIDDERFGMRRFVYYNNAVSGDNSEPSKATDYYNYLKGRWKNGRRMWYGGDGLRTGTIENLECDFMFPDDSDPWHWGTNGVTPSEHPMDWRETVAPADRRFMQSAGPFTLKPGALNYITVGIPFAQAASGGAWQSVELLREIDDVCQALFENCFKVLDGPDAPTLVVQEMNNEVVLYITYDDPSSNNYGESYKEEDPSIVRTFDDREYRFEGYQIYQLVDANASIADIEDVTKARLVAQCDIENYYDDAKTLPIATLVNFETNSTTGLLTGKIMVSGANKGIQHVFRITTDQFATGNNTNLVNNKEYYYICVAYAHNRYKEYSQTESAFLDGQKEPYLAGRKDEHGQTISPVVAIPHNTASENGGTIIQSEFGLCPNITRLEGYGNGGYNLQLTPKSIESLMGPEGTPGMAPGEFTYNADGTLASIAHPCLIAHPEYEQNAGPVNVRVINPLNVKEGRFVINFSGLTNWFITNEDPTKPVYDTVYKVYSDFPISRYNEQLFLDLGIAVSIADPEALATPLEVASASNKDAGIYYGGFVNANSVLNSSMTHADVTKQWLSGIPDNDDMMMFNWIRSGVQYARGTIKDFLLTPGPISMTETYLDEDFFKFRFNSLQGVDDNQGIDKDNAFEDVVSGLWAPYGLVSTLDYHPGFSYQYYMPEDDKLAEITSNPTFGSKYEKNLVRRKLMDNTISKAINFNNIGNAPSVRIVLTADTSKWTRCPVLEMCDDRTQSQGNARKFHKRIHKSVDKLGRTVDDLGIAPNTNDPSNPAYIDAEGMGWFPGYAISLSTGERLNIMFGEDSRYVQFNGRDMLWNPVQTYLDGTQNYVMGGRHFIYVMNASKQKFYNFAQASSISPNTTEYITPSYDAGRWSNMMLGSLDHLMNYTDGLYDGQTGNMPNVYYGVVNDEAVKKLEPIRDSISLLFASVAWVNMPLVNGRFAFNYPGHDETLNSGCASNGIPCDVTVDINVNNPYGKYYGPNGTGSSHMGIAATNGDYPKYLFELNADEATLTGQALRADAEQSYKESILQAIGVVPNPYYSYSAYETLSQLETKVRFVNIPGGSTISIYTLDGTLVRRLGPTTTAPHRDDNTMNPSTTVDWDLHNHTGLPIAGGMYLIHVSVPEIGERVIKWFGTMRPVDLNSFQF